MRNLKKVIALVAVFAMLVSTVAFAQSYKDVANDGNYYEAIEMLSSLNILTGDKDDNGNAVFRPNDPITRAEVATIVERIQNINNASQVATPFSDVKADHWASGYIAQAAGQGIINGYGDGKFGPEDNVLYEQVIKMLVETLGYAPFVEANGGYYAGHLLAASRYGILDGVVGGAPGKEATRGQVAQLVYNAIDTPVMERSAFGTETKYEIFDGGKDGNDEFVTLLTRDLGIVKGTAVVSSNAAQESTINTEDSEVIDFYFADTDSKEYNCYDLAKLDKGTVYDNGTNAGLLINQEVTFYAQEIKNGEYNLISAAATSRNDMTSISLSDLISFDGNEFTYYNGDKKDKVSVASTGKITLSYNGKTIGSYNNAADLKSNLEDYFNVATNHKLYSGQITLIDNGTANGYSIISLQVAVTAVVDEIRGDVVKFKQTVKTTDGKSFSSLDFDPDETDTLIKLTKNGDAIDYADLTEWDVISILANDDNEYYIATVIDSGKVDGAVEERAASTTSADGYEYRIGGEYYDVAAYAYGTGALRTDSAGTFYIDSYGKIVAFDKTSSTGGVSSDKYAYILNTSVTQDDWQKDNIRVQWLDKSGEIGDTYVAPSFKIENISSSLANTIAGTGVTVATEEMTDGTTYKVATIKMEDIAADKTSTRVDAIAAALKNQVVTYALSTDELKTITFPQKANEDGDILYLAKEGAANYDETDKELSFNAGGKYDIADDTLVFFIDGDNDIINGGAIDYTVDASKYLSKVSTGAALTSGNYNYVQAYDLDDAVPSVVVVYDESGLVSPASNIAVIESVGDATIDGEAVKSITYWMNGAVATAYEDPNASTSGDYDITNAAAGDVWKLSLNGTTVSAARRLASITRDNKKADEAGAAIMDAGTLGTNEVDYFGPVTEYKSAIGKLSFANASGAGYDFENFSSIKPAKANVYVVEYVRGKLVVSVGDAIDAEYNDELVDQAISATATVKAKDSAQTELVGAGEDALGLMDFVYAVEYDEDIQDIVIYKANDLGKYTVNGL